MQHARAESSTIRGIKPYIDDINFSPDNSVEFGESDRYQVFNSKSIRPVRGRNIPRISSNERVAEAIAGIQHFIT